jgi:hypothetical protein
MKKLQKGRTQVLLRAVEEEAAMILQAEKIPEKTHKKLIISKKREEK